MVGVIYFPRKASFALPTEAMPNRGPICMPMTNVSKYHLQPMALSRVSIAAKLLSVPRSASEVEFAILSKRAFMKTLIASIFALTLLGTYAADAAVIGVHVGGIGIGVGAGHHLYRHYRHR